MAVFVCKFKQNLEVLGLSEVPIPEKVSDREKDEKWSNVETPEEQPVDLVVEHLKKVDIEYHNIFLGNGKSLE